MRLRLGDVEVDVRPRVGSAVVDVAIVKGDVCVVLELSDLGCFLLAKELCFASAEGAHDKPKKAPKRKLESGRQE